MQLDQFKAAREKYAYIPAHIRHCLDSELDELAWASRPLVTDIPADWPSRKHTQSSARLDQFHRRLLQSLDDEDLIQGLISVLFWGFISDPKGGLRPERALSRAKCILYGRQGARPQDQPQIVGYLKRSRELLSQMHISEALLTAMKIKFLGMSFASKVLTFMDPEKASIYDSVISVRLKKDSDEEMRNLFVDTKNSSGRDRAEQGKIYAEWCTWCSKRADELNSDGSRWCDWDSSEHIWRAVDVERAFFALGRNRDRSAI